MDSSKRHSNVRHILIVEDDEMMQSLLSAYLDNEGYCVSGVATGQEMLTFLGHTSVDLCLLDVSLPDEDGLTLARRLRARSNLPIIIMTARTDTDDRKTIDFEGWKMDISGHTLCTPDGMDIPLTTGEFNLLSALVLAPNRVLSRDHLLDAVSHNDEPPSDRMIDVFVSRLRKKIEQDPRLPKYILTILGHGYKFAAIS